MKDTKWRTLIRIEKIDSEYLYVVIPGWNPHKIVKIPLNNLSFPLRTHAYVNIGADDEKDLTFDKWEWSLNKE